MGVLATKIRALLAQGRRDGAGIGRECGATKQWVYKIMKEDGIVRVVRSVPKEKIIDLLSNGLTHPEIGRALGMAPHTITNIIRRYRLKPAISRDRQKLIRIRELKKKGLSDRKIRKETGYHLSVIRRLRGKYGIETIYSKGKPKKDAKSRRNSAKATGQKTKEPSK